MDMIDRYKNWMINHGNETDSESESDADAANNSDDSDWNLTVKGSSPYIVDALQDDHNSKMMQSLSISESRHGHQRISLWFFFCKKKPKKPSGKLIKDYVERIKGRC